MSQRHTVPSEAFWAITPFSFETPDGWSARQTATHLAYLTPDDEPGTNCGILWRRVAGQLTLDSVTQMAMGRLRLTDADAKVGVSKKGLLRGRPAYVRIAELTVGDGEQARRKGQYYTAFFGPRFGPDRPVELFEIVGHFDVEQAHRVQEIADVAASFEFQLRPRAVADADAG